MKYMQDIMMRLVDVPLARMFVLASIIFLLFAVLGKIEGKIEPGKIGRIGAIIVGVILLTVGLAMHFNETDALRNRLREGLGAPPSAPTQALSSIPDGSMVRLAMATPGGAIPPDRTGANEKTENAKSAIRVLTGTYGSNCGAKPGNATAQVARACDGQAVCQYKIDTATPGDATPACARDFAAEWKCGTAATVYAVTMPAGAMQGEQLRLSCAAFQ
ncbi:MAG: hypothetical protein NUV34_05290 [Sulfuricaulis sp.]|nr:hypothetical protein [Sulfuricaulis sp.]